MIFSHILSSKIIYFYGDCKDIELRTHPFKYIWAKTFVHNKKSCGNKELDYDEDGMMELAHIGA